MTHIGIEDVPEFIELLKWKDSQGLVFYTKDHGQSDSTHVHSSDDIHPFWDQFSDKLSSLYDPITKNTYEPLRVDETWWRSFKSDDLRFHTSCSSVLKEISSLNGVYKSMQEILYQSNPDSLNPIISYTGYTGNHSSVNGVRSSRTKPIISSTEAGSNTDTKPVTQYQDESGFVIFSDYFSD